MRFLLRTTVTTAVLLLTILTAGPASAAVITLRTGVDGSNAVLPPGSPDPAWTISVDGGATFVPAEVLYPVQLCCSMETVAPTAAWISDPSITPNSPNTGWGVNEDVFLRRTFDLTGHDPLAASLSGTWRIADWTFGISLNGNLIPGTAIGNCGDNQACGTWFSDHLLTVAAGSGFFLPGLNTLEFRAQSLNSAWDGLWFDGQVQLPEPGLLVLTVTAVGAIGMRRRRGGVR